MSVKKALDATECIGSFSQPLERTLLILKPDAVAGNTTGAINAKFESAGLRIVAQKRLLLTQEQAKAFYVIHKDRQFYKDLVSFMISGPVIVQVLEGKDAVAQSRKIIGDTDPKKATVGTVRREFAKSIDANCVHGSDSVANAEQEIKFFFAEIEILH